MSENTALQRLARRPRPSTGSGRRERVEGRGRTRPPVLDAFVQLMEVILLALCVPVVIVLVGLPVVLLVRLILEITQRL